MIELTDIQKRILQTVAGLKNRPESGAFNLRLNGQGSGRRSTEHIRIDPKTDNPGIEIHIQPGTKGESVHIPVLLTESGLKDMVYNDFYVGDGSDVTIVAGCGINNCGCDDAQHDGVHTFYIGKNAHVIYTEKHYGEGSGGKRIMNPQTVVYLDEGASMEMETVQIRGIDDTHRSVKAELKAGSELVVTERILTHAQQSATSEMTVRLIGQDAKTRVISRAVAKDDSTQIFYPRVIGECACFGHVQCDAIIMDHAKVRSIPEISANHVDASLIHEAAIGKIAGEQLLKLMTLGLTSEQAEEKILEGFLR